MIFKLQDFYSTPLTKLVIKSQKAPNKGWTNAHHEFEPDTEYETHDPVLISYIKGETGDVMEKPVKTPQMVELLEMAGVPYVTKKSCSSCANAKPHIWFNPFKVVSEEGDE